MQQSRFRADYCASFNQNRLSPYSKQLFLLQKVGERILVKGSAESFLTILFFFPFLGRFAYTCETSSLLSATCSIFWDAAPVLRRACQVQRSH